MITDKDKLAERVLLALVRKRDTKLFTVPVSRKIAREALHIADQFCKEQAKQPRSKDPF